MSCSARGRFFLSLRIFLLFFFFIVEERGEVCVFISIAFTARDEEER